MRDPFNFRLKADRRSRRDQFRQAYLGGNYLPPQHSPAQRANDVFDFR